MYSYSQSCEAIQAAGTQMPGAKWLKLVTPSSFTLLKITGEKCTNKTGKKKECVLCSIHDVVVGAGFCY